MSRRKTASEEAYSIFPVIRNIIDEVVEFFLAKAPIYLFPSIYSIFFSVFPR